MVVIYIHLSHVAILRDTAQPRSAMIEPLVFGVLLVIFNVLMVKPPPPAIIP